MDDLIRESMEGFDDVWRRVTGRPEVDQAPTPSSCPPGICTPEDTLSGLIDQEACAAFQSAALARMCQGDGRTILMRHAAEAKRRLRRLRAEQFIAEGQAVAGRKRCPMPDEKLIALRSLYLRASALGEAHEKAAGLASDPVLAEVFKAFAEENRRRAKELRALLVESFR